VSTGGHSGDAAKTPERKAGGHSDRVGAASPQELLARIAAAAPRSERYEIQGELARGGMGLILKVFDRDLRRTLAMKALRRKAKDGEGGREGPLLVARFLEEAQITAQLGHPGIVPVHDLGVDAEGRAFFTMPLVRGRNLAEAFDCVRDAREGWTLTRGLGALLKVCEAVGYAHDRGVVHRDLKPANVMVGRFGEVYVMDWGLARVLGAADTRDLRLRDEPSTLHVLVESDRSRAKVDTPESPLVTLDGDVIGTPAYMAPEQALGRVDLMGPRSDVYAIGAMLYHLLSGRMPYEQPGLHAGARSTLERVRAGPPASLAELAPAAPGDLVAVCARAMHRDPDRRYAGVLELAADLEAFLERRPVRAREAGLAHALGLFVERHRAAVLAGVAGLAALLGLGGYSHWSVRAALRDTRAANTRAELALSESQRRADVNEARVLVEEEQALWPATPARAEALQHWLARMRDVVEREELHRASLEGGVTAAGEAAGLERFLTDAAALRELEPRIVQRLELARALPALSTGGEHAAAWSRAIAEVAAAPAYAGLALAPQLGLVPLGADPRSGLQEFWHVASGLRPERAATGELVLGADSGVVLVLLPGGEIELGEADDAVPRGIQRNRQPPWPTRVEPFFAGKFEVTQGQWLRAMGANPSRYPPGHPLVSGVTLLHPVESVSWTAAASCAARLDLELPTEAQWEYAARGRSTALFWWGGDDPAGLEGRENVLDVAGGAFLGMKPAAWDDGWKVHAPVGSFEPNPFGLCDALGNVKEWCRDWFAPYPTDATPGDFVLETTRPFRGGNWFEPGITNRVSLRANDFPGSINPNRGLRLARALRE
jgi:formylglycine-generating enzyme required for sulfatase activity